MSTLRTNPLSTDSSDRRSFAHDRRHLAQEISYAFKEILIVTVAVLTYFLGRGIIDRVSSVAVVTENLHTTVSFERRLGIFHEPTLQSWVVDRDWVVTTLNSFYIYGHWPLIISTLLWLLWKRRDQFPIYRSAFIISGAIGLIFFITYPMAPPRMFPELGFVDTVALHTEAYRASQPTIFSNEYAAMPSLHVGWNLLIGIAIFHTTRHWFWRGFAIIMPLAMFLTTILTANHLIVDGIVGSTVTVASIMIAARLNAWRRRSRMQSETSSRRTLITQHGD